MTTIRLKRRASGGAAGAPVSLATTEPAYNEADDTLYIGFGDNGSGVATSVIAIAGAGTFATKTYVSEQMAGAGTGDMLKSVYDTNNDGKVDAAAAADTVPWGGVSGTPTTLAGYGIADAAPASHVGAGGTAHAVATTAVNGFMSSADKTKLDGIASGAQVNQSAFSSIAVTGQTTVAADSASDTLTLVNGTGIAITTNATSDSVTVSATAATTSAAGTMSAADKTKLDGVAAGATANSSDATLLARGNHTGTQSADTITDGTTNKAYTAGEKTKLNGIESGADVTDAVNVAAAVNGATAKTTPVAADRVVLMDSAATNALAYMTYSNLLSAMQTTITAAIVDTAPGTLDTLNELAAALGDDPNFATTINNNLAAKAPLASPALTGTPTAPTASAATSNTQIATTAHVHAAIGAATIDGGTF